MQPRSFLEVVGDKIASLLPLPAPRADDLVMPPEKATSLLKQRAHDHQLRARISEYLRGDIPAYFREEPVICSARYVVSPNFETLGFLQMTESFHMRTVLTQDTKDMFTPTNIVKKALCKLPICVRVTIKNGQASEHYTKVRITDVNAAAGKPFSDIKTFWGENLVSFHGNLFSKYIHSNVEVCDDTAWINRNGRGDLLELYKRYLALFVAHGALFEDFTMNDEYEINFTNQVVRPAFRFIEERFGQKPLIVQSVPRSTQSNLYWVSYPPAILGVVREKMRGLPR